MKIYIASSWKNENVCIEAAKRLRNNGHEVDCFCDTSTGRFVFSFAQLPDISIHDGISIMDTEEVKKAFLEDKKWIDWADVLIVILPCGKSAHLEAGYAKGTGKKLYFVGEFQKGEFDVMYGFADGLYRTLYEVIKCLDMD